MIENSNKKLEESAALLQALLKNIHAPQKCIFGSSDKVDIVEVLYEDFWKDASVVTTWLALHRRREQQILHSGGFP